MRVLLVSIAFPPKRDPESLQVARYCKYLKQRKDMQLEVVTSKDPTLFMEPDDALKSYAEGIKVVLRIGIFENRYLNFLIRKINPNLLRYPDSKFSFWWQHRRVKHSIQKPELIYSRSYPMSSTLLALELKKKWKVPWVLHLSDPWAVATENSQSPAVITGKARLWNRMKEQKSFELADKICLTSHKTVELYRKEYPHLKNKFVYMPNVYDDDRILDNPLKLNHVLTFTYTGGFAAFRSPLPLLEAIRKFWDRTEGKIDGQVQFLFTGEIARVNQKIFSQYGDLPIIKHLGVVPHERMVTLQREADILINVDTDILEADQAVYFPSKLLEYILAQRRILAITNHYSTTYQVVQNRLGDCFGFDEIEKLAEYFSSVLDKFVKRDTSYFFIKKIDQEFSAQQNANRLAELFIEVKNNPITLNDNLIH
jgi:Glycosyltransferase Family 4